ncbi:MAG: hypothetical protein U0164_01555 [Gemmatimonadaceae bacterium]
MPVVMLTWSLVSLARVGGSAGHEVKRALASIDASATPPGRSSPPVDPRPVLSGGRPRRFPPVTLHLRWEIGGAAEDTTFLLPFSLASTRRYLIVYDAIARRVVALDPSTGREAWRLGRAGRGPDEFGGVAFVTPRAEGGVRILDLGNLRLSSLSDDGKHTGRYAFPLGSDPRGVCDVTGAQIRLRALVDHEIQRVVGDSTVASDGPLPWAEMARQPSLVRQSLLFAHPGDDACLLSMTFGPRFSILDKNGVRATGEWIEQVPLANARALGMGSWTMMPGSVISTTSATGIGRSFAVLFEGRSNQRKRVVDFYSSEDAAYLFSIGLPFEAKAVSYGHGLLILAGETDDGAPFVRAFSATPSLEVMVARAWSGAERAARHP